MAQPVWITPPGSLGTIAEGVFYEVPLEAYDPDNQPLYYQLLAGQLPSGIEIDNATGRMVGTPKAVAIVDGVPTQVSQNITSKFAVRAYTKNILGGVARLADRTFTITVAGENTPEFLTPAGNIGTYFDGTVVSDLQIQYTDTDIYDPIVVKLAGGQLPPGLSISPTGLITGYIEPNTNAGVAPGFSRDSVGFDQYTFDYSTISSTVNYEFVLEVTDGKTNNLRNFTILVYSRNSCTADDTQFTADNTFITADCTPTRVPAVLTPQGLIGTARNDNFFAFKFDGFDPDGDPFQYTISLGGTIGFDILPRDDAYNFLPGSYDYNGESFDQGGLTLPPGLTLDANTGWLYGYIPNLGITELSYEFAIQVFKTNNPSVISQYYFYTLNIIGNVSSQVTWLTPSDPVELAKTPSSLGTIDNGAISEFYVEAVNVSGIPLQYRLESGSNSSLPQGLSLLPDGEIAGRVSFDTFALDGGTTTFDVNSRNIYNPNNPTSNSIAPTTFDMTHTFTVNAYSLNGVVSVFKTFSITVNRAYNVPFDNLYIQAMPPENDRALLTNLLQNADIFPQNLLYRPQDPNFGLATKVVYWHAYGLAPEIIDSYVEALNLNHYQKNLVLGSIETAQALDADGNVVYEVVYSRVVDNLANNQGDSVGKEVKLPYTIPGDISVVYPNSLVDMRTQVIDTVGQISNVLPSWMISKQANGQILGFTPAWVIAYTKPGKSGQIAYNIKTIFGDRLNLVDFDVDRYELDNLLTKNWDRENQQWNPTPPSSTTFDAGGVRNINSWVNDLGFPVVWVNDYNNLITWTALSTADSPTIFDGNSLQFIEPVDMYSNTQIYDKYLLFPKRNILG